jgi:xanthine/CO dehydrogenase XdhC/CoxF family maturation factor
MSDKMSAPLNEAELRATALAWRYGGRGVAIATVVETWGSAPRAAGSHLIVDDSGHFAGSVSGGCVEADVIVAAQDCIEDGVARLLEFGVEDEVAWRAGLPCGGRVAIYVEKVD